jgi:hypothetical protein
LKKPELHISSKSLLVLLAAVIIPAVISFIIISRPVEVDIFVGPAAENPFPDGLDWLRRLLIYPGIFLTFVSAVIFVRSASGKNAAPADKILNYFIFLLIFCIGTVCLPYWANGLHHVFWSGTSSLYDPKSLLPFNDISFIWNSAVFLFYALAFVLIIIPLFLAIIDSRKNGFNGKYIIAASAYLLIFVVFRFAPNYLYWFLD